VNYLNDMDDKPSTAGAGSIEEKAKKIAGDNKPQHNMFAKEIIMTEKEKMRQKLVTEKEAMKEVCMNSAFMFVCSHSIASLYNYPAFLIL
jgi:hypothetical protein